MSIEITLTIADLSQALKDNDLDKTIELTNYLNNNIDLIPEKLNYIFYGDGNFPIVHESFDYILNNAKFLEDTKVIIFRRQIKKIINNQDKIKAKNFIIDVLSNNFDENLILYKTFYNDLIAMGNLVDDYNFLPEIKEYIEEKGEVN